MLSSQVMSVLNELRDGPDGNWIADILTRAFAAQHADIVGSVKIETDERDLNTNVVPPDTPILHHEDLSAGLTVTHRFGFHPPGGKGAQGGWAARFRGPTAMTPNKPGDIVLSAPDGAIDAQQLYQDGEPVIVIPELPDTGTYVLIVVDGELEWKAAGPCP